MYDNLYCKIFIDTDIDYNSLFNLILNYISGKKQAVSYIISDWCDISIRRNKEYILEEYLNDSKNFLCWKYYLDIDPINMDEKQYISNVVNLIRYLKECNMGVVIASDFEDEVKNML